MEQYVDAFLYAFVDSLDWTWKSVLLEVPWYINYFWGLVTISLIVWMLEILFPWRKNQSIFRKDFWLDAFYMFFNFFVFSIIISGFYKIIAISFSKVDVSMSSISLMDLSMFPTWLQLIVFFILLDFVQWITHILLHKYPMTSSR